MNLSERWRTFRDDRSLEGGYVAVMTGILLMVLMGLAAFAVDVGQWYLVGQQEQRAADAAALAGVTKLPADLAGAQATALSFSKINRFENLPSAATNPTTVAAGLDGGRPTRLRVTVTRTVDNIFGPLLGVPKTTISRTAVADYGGPVPMGSPCNEFGNDPEPASNQGVACTDVTGQMWANVNSPNSSKANGDAYQSSKGCSSSVDGCSGSTNSDYNPDGYFYTVSVKASMPSLTIELFDPVFVDTGLLCDNSNFGSSGNNNLSTSAANDQITDQTTRYASGTGTTTSPRPFCTGDGSFGGSSQVMNTQFTVRDPSPNEWNPSAFPVHSLDCQKTYPGYSGNLFNVLDQYSSGTTPRSTYNKDSTGTTTTPTIVNGFRRWTTLCTITPPVVGDYLVQVKTNFGDARDNADATNHFAIRAYTSGSGSNDSISIAGRGRMGMYTNKPGATNEFHLARVPTGAAGQMLKLSLFDVGDSDQAGTIYILPPVATGGFFAGCKGVLSTGAAVSLTDCKFGVTPTPSDHNGKWQTVTVPIPSNYSCVDSDPRACWVRLKYDYGSGSAPHDVTSWAASIDGDPVRLVE